MKRISMFPRRSAAGLLGGLLLAMHIVTSAFAQRPGGEAVSTDGEELTVYLMTMGPGSAVWERFGHNAIWIRDAVRGTNVAYNYGMFSFEQENFLLRFIRGQMDYWMQGFDAEDTARMYIAADRSVWAQELNLSPAQRVELRDFLEWNSLPENRFYRYDYYLDNCSTRVRDAIDLVLGGQIRAQTEGVEPGTTYRRHTRALTSGDPLLYTGLMLGLGQPVDRSISAWEEMFLPMRLRDWVREVTVLDEGGRSVPLVLQEHTLFLAGAEEADAVPGSRVWVYLVVGLFLAGLLVLSGTRLHRSRAAGRTFVVAAVVWSVVAGLLGLVLVGLWAFTDHQTSYRNENILQFSPLLLPLALLLPRALGRAAAGARPAFAVAAAVAGLSVLGLVLQVLPAFSQVNGEMIALALPINLAIALVLWAMRGRRVEPTTRGRRRSVPVGEAPVAVP